MIDPNNLLHIEDTIQRELQNQLKVLVFDSIPEYDVQSYDIYSDKEFKKFIQDVEKDVRSSIEYKRFIQFIKTHMGMNESTFMEDIEQRSGGGKIKIEQHHSPFTLLDIAVIVFNKRFYYNESLDLRQVSKEVTKLHYYLVVGLVPLTKTEHQLVHNMYLFVPADRVFGDYGKFINYYKEFMSPEQLDIIYRIEQYSLEYNRAANEIILQNNLITLDTSVSYSLPKFDNVLGMLEDKVNNIKSNGYKLLSVEEEKRQEENKDKEYFNNKTDLIECIRFAKPFVGFN